MNYSDTKIISNNSLSVAQYENGTMEITDHEDKEHNGTNHRDYLTAFSESYRQVHFYLCLVVCIFGLISNIFIIIVLRKKNMTSPINAILIGLAVADMIFVSSEIPLYVRHITVQEDKDEPYQWVIFKFSLLVCGIVSHTISAWLTVTVAIWRLVAVSFPLISKTWLDMKRAKIAIVTTYVVSILFCSPYFVSETMVGYEKDNKIKNDLEFSDIWRNSNETIQSYYYWFFSVVVQLIPCFIITVLTVSLMFVLCKANHQRKKLMNPSEMKTHHRTTKMLLMVLLIFLMNNIPWGVLILLILFTGKAFLITAMHFFKLFDFLSRINSAINFIIFCSMSRSFRKTFILLFLLNRDIKKRKIQVITESSR